MDDDGGFDAKALVARQWREYRRRTPGLWFAEGHRALERDEAYAVQFEVARLRIEAGDVVVGYKVGCTGPGLVAQFGMSGPIHARLFGSELRTAGATLRHADYANLAIEGEIAVRIGEDGSIAACFPVIELHHYFFRGTPKTLGELIANNGINAGVVLPADTGAIDVERWRSACVLAVEIDGCVVDSGPLWAMAGGAGESVQWLRDDLARQGLALVPGDIVLTGTSLKLHPLRPGQHVVVSVDGRPMVDCHVAASVSREWWTEEDVDQNCADAPREGG